MEVNAPVGKRLSTTPRQRKRHKPEQIFAKLRDADAMLNSGKDLSAGLQALESSEATLARWRALVQRDEVR